MKKIISRFLFNAISIFAIALGTASCSFTNSYEEEKKRMGGDDIIIDDDPPIEEDKTIHVSVVYFGSESFNMLSGTQTTVVFGVLPNNAANKEYSLVSSRQDVATIDKDGLITALKPGETILTLTSDDGNKTASCKVIVLDNTSHVERVLLDKQSLTLKEGTPDVALSANVFPTTVLNKEVIWKSSDESVCTVTQDGLVHPVGIGKATIQATSKDNGRTGQCKITIVSSDSEIEDEIHAQAVEISKHEASIETGGILQLTATVFPEESVNKEVVWNTDSPLVATVTQDGLVQGLSAGKAEISAVSVDGLHVGKCVINVIDRTIKVEQVLISSPSLDMIVGDDAELTCVVLPYNAENKDVVWSSNNESVVTVDQNGKVHAAGAGDAIISVKNVDSNKEAQCLVSVTTPGSGGKKTTLEKIMEKYDNLDWTYSGGPTSISFAHWDSEGATTERAIINQVLKGFYKRYPDISVTVDILADYENNYSNKVLLKNTHDVFLVPDGALYSWARVGQMENLDPYINSSKILKNLNDIYPSGLSRYQYDGNRPGSGAHYALPKDVGPYVMYYNKDILNALGINEPPADRIMSIDEATTFWQQIAAKNTGSTKIWPVAGLGIEGLVFSAGGDFLNASRTAFPENGTAEYNGLYAGYDYMQKAYKTYNILPDSGALGVGGASALFKAGNCACLCSGRWEVTTLKNIGFNWDITYIPAFQTNPTKNMYSGSVGYAISQNSAKKEAAWKLVEYISSEEGQEILAATGFQIPIYKTLALSNDVKAREAKMGYSNYEVFVNSAQNQPYGLWQYRPTITWKTIGYDGTSAHLYDDIEAQRWTVTQFLNEAKGIVNSYM